jgi:hypothetical protein
MVDVADSSVCDALRVLLKTDLPQSILQWLAGGVLGSVATFVFDDIV